MPGKKRRPADEPEYRIVYRDNVDMGNFTNDRSVQCRYWATLLMIGQYNVDMGNFTNHRSVPRTHNTIFI